MIYSFLLLNVFQLLQIGGQHLMEFTKIRLNAMQLIIGYIHIGILILLEIDLE